MLFLFGERVQSKAIDAGMKECGSCGERTHFSHVVETNYFCLFGMRLFPIEKVADYLQCDTCQDAFSKDTFEPSYLAPTRQVLIYILLGYGMHEHRDLAQDIYHKITGFEFAGPDVSEAMRRLDSGKDDIFAYLKRQSSRMNALGKQQVVQAAFLMTHACCEIQYEDRLRVNLIGNSLGVSLEFVQACIETVRSHNYYGVRRLLPTQAL